MKRLALYIRLCCFCLMLTVGAVASTPLWAADTAQNAAPPQLAPVAPAKDAPQTAPAKNDSKKDATAPSATEDEDPWAVAWSSQQKFMDDVLASTAALRKAMPDITRKVGDDVLPFEQRLQQDFVLGTTYGQNPRLLEAVGERIRDTGDAVHAAMAPALHAQKEAQELITKILQMEKTIPTDAAIRNRISNESLRKYATTLAQTRKQLEELNGRLDTAMAQGNMLYAKARSAVAELDKYMPQLWVNQYFVPPIRYIDKDLWTDIKGQLASTMTTFNLRMSMEMPQTQELWISVLARFGVTLLVGLLLSLVAYRRLHSGPHAEVYEHIFHTSVPWLVVGLAVIVSSLPSREESIYCMLLSLGNLLLIVGQISLAWDLRRIALEDSPRLSPLWIVCMPTMVAYLLLYPDLPLSVLAVLWTLVLLVALLWQRFSKPSPNIPTFERCFLQMEPVILWISLVATIFGFPRHAILFYLLFAMIAVSLQLSVGSLRFIHTSTKDLSDEGLAAIFGNMVVALTAPVILLVIVTAMAMWVVTLPGGVYLIRHYGSWGIHVGTTNFNIMQVLLIISVFYLARAIISIGSNMLRHMPEQGISIDKTMLPPIQTAFVYTVWALFGLFVLNAVGLDLKSLAVVAGGLSVGIGFGMQAIVNNFMSGLILIFSRSLQEGDVIEVGGINGVVRKINVRATTIETYDNAVIYVPNSDIVSNRIVNWTRNSRTVRREITIGVAYGTDPNLVMRLLRETADACPDVLKYPAPTVLFVDFGNSTLDFRLRFWVRDYNQGLSTSSTLRVAMEKIFREHNVDIAFPQLDVHIKDAPSPLPVRKSTPPPAAKPLPAAKADTGTTAATTNGTSKPASESRQGRHMRRGLIRRKAPTLHAEQQAKEPTEQAPEKEGQNKAD